MLNAGEGNRRAPGPGEAADPKCGEQLYRANCAAGCSDRCENGCCEPCCEEYEPEHE